MNGIQFILELSYVAARRRCTGAERRAAVASSHWTRSKMGLRRNWKAEFSLYPLSARGTPHSLFLSFSRPSPLSHPRRPFFHAISRQRTSIQNGIYLYIFRTAKYEMRNKNGHVEKNVSCGGDTWITVLDNKSRLISGNVNENSL